MEGVLFIAFSPMKHGGIASSGEMEVNCQNLCQSRDMNPKKILIATTLLAAAASLVMSVYLYFSGDEVFDRLNGIFVGVWVPSILSLGAFLVSATKEK